MALAMAHKKTKQEQNKIAQCDLHNCQKINNIFSKHLQGKNREYIFAQGTTTHNNAAARLCYGQVPHRRAFSIKSLLT